jgi:hypothetical protein
MILLAGLIHDLTYRFNIKQILGCCLIMVGVAVAAVSPSTMISLVSSAWQMRQLAGPDGSASVEVVTAVAAAAVTSVESAPLVDPVYVAACVLCFAFPALASTIKVTDCMNVSCFVR